MSYDAATLDLLRAATHERGCKWFDDDDWNSGTFSNYVRAYGKYPECTCSVIQKIATDGERT